VELSACALPKFAIYSAGQPSTLPKLSLLTAFGYQVACYNTHSMLYCTQLSHGRSGSQLCDANLLALPRHGEVVSGHA